MHVFSWGSYVGAGAGQVYAEGNWPEQCLHYIVGNWMWCTPCHNDERVRQEEERGGHKEAAAD